MKYVSIFYILVCIFLSACTTNLSKTVEPLDGYWMTTLNVNAEKSTLLGKDNLFYRDMKMVIVGEEFLIMYTDEDTLHILDRPFSVKRKGNSLIASSSYRDNSLGDGNKESWVIHINNEGGTYSIKSERKTYKESSSINPIIESTYGFLSYQEPPTIVESSEDHSAIVGDSDVTPLMMAVMARDFTSIVDLIERGVNVNDKTEWGYTALHIATGFSPDNQNRKNLAIVELLLDSGFDINATTNLGWSPLKRAVDTANVEIVELLVSRGADLNVKDTSGWTELHQAMSRNNKSDDKKRQIAAILLEAGANIDEINNKGNTPLHLAAINNLPLCVGLLIDSGANLDAISDEGYSVLQEAVLSGNVDIVKTLIDHAADLSFVNEKGWSALHITTLLEDEMDVMSLQIVKFLVSSGIDVDAQNYRGETALSLAIRKSRLNTALALIEANANTNLADPHGRTPLMKAIYWGNIEMVGALLANGADSSVGDLSGWSPLHLTAYSKIKGGEDVQSKIVNMLLDSGADINQVDNYGETPLVRAVIEGKSNIIDLFLNNEADTEIVDKDGWTALHHSASDKTSASDEAQAKITQRLLSSGANINTENYKGRTPLYNSSHYGRSLTMDVLLLAGADVNVKSKSGWSALAEAVNTGNINGVRSLLSYGADVNSQDNKGWTPLMLTTNGKNSGGDVLQAEIASILLDAGADATLTLKTGYTVLMNAAEEERLEVAKVLINRGVDVFTKNLFDHDRTAFDYAELANSVKMIDYLSQFESHAH